MTGGSAGEDASAVAALWIDFKTSHGAALGVGAFGIVLALARAKTFGGLGRCETKQTVLTTEGVGLVGIGGADAAEWDGADGWCTKADIAEGGFAAESCGACTVVALKQARSVGLAVGVLECEAGFVGRAAFSGGLTIAFPEVDAEIAPVVEIEAKEALLTGLGGIEAALLDGGRFAALVRADGANRLAHATGGVDRDTFAIAGALGSAEKALAITDRYRVSVSVVGFCTKIRGFAGAVDVANFVSVGGRILWKRTVGIGRKIGRKWTVGIGRKIGRKRTIGIGRKIGRKRTIGIGRKIGRKRTIGIGRKIGRKRTIGIGRKIGRKRTIGIGRKIGRKRTVRIGRKIGRKRTVRIGRKIGRKRTIGIGRKIGRKWIVGWIGFVGCGIGDGVG